MNFTIVESFLIYNFVIQLKFDYLDNFLQKSLAAIDYAYYIHNFEGGFDIFQFQLKKDYYLNNSFYFSWSKFFIQDESISKNRFYLDFFSSKMGIPLFDGIFFRKELGKQWLLLLRSSSTFVIKSFLDRKLNSRFDIDIFPAALDYSSICRISSESSQWNPYSWFFIFSKFYICSSEFVEPKQTFTAQMNFEYDYLLPYGYIKKTNYDIVSYQMLPFLSQYEYWRFDNDSYNHGYSKAIAQRSPQKPQKTLYVFSLEGGSIIRILKKKDSLRRFSSKIIRLGTFSYNWVPFFSRVQKNRFTDRRLFRVSLKLPDGLKYFNRIFYYYLLNPLHNFSKVLLWCSFLLCIYPIKTLLEADNCISYFFYSVIIFLLIYSISLFFKLLCYFLLGFHIKASKLDIDINVVMFFFSVAFILFSVLGNYVNEPFLMFDVWYKSVLHKILL